MWNGELDGTEIEESPLAYSLIKADRWSCGHVILYFLERFGQEHKLLRAIVRKLKVYNPTQRPSLLRWHTWVTASYRDVPNVGNIGEQTALRPRQDTVEVNGESMKPPKAKKPRLTGSDQNEGERMLTEPD
jgi:hypothetical protein